MSVSAPFIQRPIATSLLGLATLLAGLLGYISLPVASLRRASPVYPEAVTRTAPSAVAAVP